MFPPRQKFVADGESIIDHCYTSSPIITGDYYKDIALALLRYLLRLPLLKIPTLLI